MARSAVKVRNRDPVAGAEPARKCGSDLLSVIRRKCRTSLTANRGCWHARSMSVSVTLNLAAGCSSCRLRPALTHSGCRHGQWRLGRHAARE